MSEARLERAKYGLAPVEDGWFVVNTGQAVRAVPEWQPGPPASFDGLPFGST